MNARPLILTFSCRAGLALLLSTCVLQAHICGPPRIEVKVGQACLWRVFADRQEALSQYVPTVAGPAGIAEVYPKSTFFAHHGDFLITGVQPGTNTLVVNWS